VPREEADAEVGGKARAEARAEASLVRGQAVVVRAAEEATATTDGKAETIVAVGITRTAASKILGSKATSRITWNGLTWCRE
jgi:hypothetical protein